MFDEILPRLYRSLRRRAGFSQRQYALLIGVSRSMVVRYEKGTYQPKAPQLAKMAELANCSRQEFVELFCEPLSEVSGTRVGIVEGQDQYRPSTAISKAHDLVEKHGDKMSSESFTAISDDIHDTQFLSVIMDRRIAQLKKRTFDCQKEIDGRKAAAPKS